MSIDEINIGTALIGSTKKDSDRYTNLKAVISDKTSNSVEVYIYAVSSEGVNAHQWMTISDFNKQFLVV